MSVESEYYAGTIAVMVHELQSIIDYAYNVMDRLEELQDQLDTVEKHKNVTRLNDEYRSGYQDGRDDESDWQMFWEDDEPVYDTFINKPCSCGMCNDPGYRMD